LNPPAPARRLERSPFLYFLGERACRVWVHLRFQRQVEFATPLRGEPGHVLVFLYKHQRMGDIPIVGTAINRHLGLQCSWVMKYSLGTAPLSGWLLQRFGGVSIIRPTRDRGVAGRRELRDQWEERLAYLEAIVNECAEPLCLAPEGTRTPGRMGRPEVGVLLRLIEGGLARGAPAPDRFPWNARFIPVGVSYGPDPGRPGRQPVSVRFGVPLRLSPEDFAAAAGGAARERLTRLLIEPAMAEIARLSGFA
jgi:1-acyl-sn-glycerol-3-phosphate acyltransferase